MAMKVERVDVWVASLSDTPGALAEKLDAVSASGANLKFVMARRAPETPGTGVVFALPLSGAKQLAAARKAGFRKTKNLYAVRAVGDDRKGMGAKLTGALAEKGVNLRGLSAMTVGKKFVLYLALDNSKDATKVVRLLKAVK
jgi:hypothetical protein